MRLHFGAHRSARRQARHYFPDTQALVSHAKAIVPRCLTSEQRKAFFLPPDPPAWCIELEKWPYDAPTWKQWLADKRAERAPSPSRRGATIDQGLQQQDANAALLL